MEKSINILIVDDDKNLFENLRDILQEDGYEITGAGTISSAKEELSSKFYNVSLIDINLPDGTGFELLKEMKKNNSDTMAIISTGFATVESAISAMNEGAFAYIQKPINIDELRFTIRRALKMQSLSFDNKKLLNILKDLSIKDPLTNLYNYRYLRERLSAEFKRAKRYFLPVSVIMIDIDYFKSINDIYGHQYGDQMLKEVAGFLVNSVRSNDVVVRYGGEEFLILMPDTSKDGAATFGKNLLDTLTSNIFDAKGKKIRLKLSMGIAGFPDAGVSSETDLLDAVDKVMRNSKEMGGNRLTVFTGIGKEEVEEIVHKGGEQNVDKLKQKLLKMGNRVNRTLLESIYAFAKTIEAKDHYTGEHAENMVALVTEIASKLKLAPKEIEDIERAAILHDLGKVGIPDNILQKKGKLTKKEYEKLKKHPQIGAEIIRSIHFLNKVALMVLYHHERFDGNGYSSGLKGEEIPIGARIVAVADVYQALTSDRPYRKAYTNKEALAILQEESGKQFDPAVVKALVETIPNKKKNNKPLK